MNATVMTLARWHARQVVKQELYAQGIKLMNVKSREITLAAIQYVEELIEFAAEEYRSLVASGRLRPPRKLKLRRT